MTTTSSFRTKQNFLDHSHLNGFIINSIYSLTTIFRAKIDKDKIKMCNFERKFEIELIKKTSNSISRYQALIWSNVVVAWEVLNGFVIKLWKHLDIYYWITILINGLRALLILGTNLNIAFYSIIFIFIDYFREMFSYVTETESKLIIETTKSYTWRWYKTLFDIQNKKTMENIKCHVSSGRT